MINNLPDEELIKIISADLYLAGQRACKHGEKHEEGKGADFDRGYADQYTIQEIMSARHGENN